MVADNKADNKNDAFSSAFQQLHLLQHPFYQDWMAGTLSREVLTNYAKQYYFHVDRFPRYLSSIHSLCENQAERQKILENLNDEEGVGFDSSHPDLWLQFAEGLGVDKIEVRQADPCSSIRNVASTFFKHCRSSYHEGLGALYAYESQIPEIAESKIEGLKTRYGIDDKQTLAFFEVHRTADVEHRSVMADMLNALPEEQKQKAQTAAIEAAQSLWDFLTEMHGKNAA